METRTLFKQLLILACATCLTTTVAARTFNLPVENESIIGNIQHTSGAGKNTPAVAYNYNLGQNALIAANAGVVENGNLPARAITIPTQYMLPPMPRNGIIINLAEMRMYYYPRGSNIVMTFPIGIGKIGKMIPIERTAITRKKINPTWTPPQDIRDFNHEQGVELPPTVGPGPDNPLGPYAIYLQIPTYLIHSTIFPDSIGRRASFGCIRMNEDDIKEFFPSVAPGTPVAIVNMPNKVGWQNNSLFLEAHPPLEEHVNDSNLATVVTYIENTTAQKQALVNWQLVSYLTDQPDGLPHEVGVKI